MNQFLHIYEEALHIVRKAEGLRLCKGYVHIR